MINVCIVGPNSYIGGSVFRRLEKEPDKYHVERLSVRDDNWKTHDLSRFDTILYAAGIVHHPEWKMGSDIYYKVNRDGTCEFAKCAKEAGVRQFIFLSSMSVYGMNSGKITKDTQPKPKTNYGRSKLEAENELEKMNCDGFAVAIIRPPLVYGSGCKGNYQRLRWFASTVPFYPSFTNKRSLVYIGNLVEAIRLIIVSQSHGVFFPQNEEYLDIGQLVHDIAFVHGKKIIRIRGFGRMLKITKMMGGAFEKVFGNLTYDKDMSEEPKGYRIYNYEQSVRLSEEEIDNVGRKSQN